MNYRDITMIPEGKIFWLDQYREMIQAAEKIAKTKETPNSELFSILLEHTYEGKHKNLKKALLKKIIELTIPREHEGAKWKEQNLF